MRSRKTWGLLGSCTGIAASSLIAAYSMAALLTMPSDASADPPSCISEELALADAEVDESVDFAIYTQAVFDLAMCEMGPGPCISEQLAAVDAEVDYETSVTIREAAEFALAECQSGP